MLNAPAQQHSQTALRKVGTLPVTSFAAGVPWHTVSELLGHPFVTVTGDVHGHVANQGARFAVQRL
jgi:hypothetical protein